MKTNCKNHCPTCVLSAFQHRGGEISPGGEDVAKDFKVGEKKERSQSDQKWKVRRACYSLRGNCAGVLSTESTLQLEFCGTFMEAFKCSAFSTLVNSLLKSCQNAREPCVFFSCVFFSKKHLLLCSSVHLAGAMTAGRAPQQLQDRKGHGLRPGLPPTLQQ